MPWWTCRFRRDEQPGTRQRHPSRSKILWSRRHFGSPLTFQVCRKEATIRATHSQSASGRPSARRQTFRACCQSAATSSGAQKRTRDQEDAHDCTPSTVGAAAHVCTPFPTESPAHICTPPSPVDQGVFPRRQGESICTSPEEERPAGCLSRPGCQGGSLQLPAGGSASIPPATTPLSS